MKNEKNGFVLKYVTENDYDFISKMIDYSNRSHKGEVGYPRCDDLKELLSEIELYENSLEESLCIIYHEDNPIGLGGYLYTHGEGFGYLIGPIIIEDYYSKENIKEIIGMILKSKKNIFTELDAVVSENNKLLRESFLELQWNKKEIQREMCFDIDSTGDYSVEHNLKEVDKNNIQQIEAIFKIFDDAFKWNGNFERMDELLSDDYRMRCVVDKDNNVIGAVCWAYLNDVDFSRLEYLVVKEEHRGNGIGRDMINFVIKDGIENNMKYIYLSTDIENNASSLYKKIGFYETLVSEIYGKNI